tara:strand:- start:720 stop:833 length:114 start_codon:yes stop_codon:yes gene_type:complete
VIKIITDDINMIVADLSFVRIIAVNVKNIKGKIIFLK